MVRTSVLILPIAHVTPIGIGLCNRKLCLQQQRLMALAHASVFWKRTILLPKLVFTYVFGFLGGSPTSTHAFSHSLCPFPLSLVQLIVFYKICICQRYFFLTMVLNCCFSKFQLILIGNKTLYELENSKQSSMIGNCLYILENSDEKDHGPIKRNSPLKSTHTQEKV